jgi:hypothetical protein
MPCDVVGTAPQETAKLKAPPLMIVETRRGWPKNSNPEIAEMKSRQDAP